MKINENVKNYKRRIFLLEAEIMKNRSQIYISRSIIEENRLMILSNYAAAFVGNRQIANNNTDEIFKNRNKIIENTYENKETDKDELQKLKAKLDFLNHRIHLNNVVLSISKEMQKINKKLSKINKKILESNQSILEFNEEQIDINEKLIKEEQNNKTPEALEEDISNSEKLLSSLETRSKLNQEKTKKIINLSAKNNKTLVKNKNEISIRRDKLIKNTETLLNETVSII